MVEALKKKRWGGRLTVLAAILCFGAVAAAVLAAVGSGNGMWHFRIGFMILRYAGYAAILGIVLAVIAIFLVRRVRPRLMLINLLAIVVAGAFVGFAGNLYLTAQRVPAIHDITTNLDDYPRYYRLTVREDNLAHIPDMDRPDFARLPPRERWKAVHRAYYGDIRTIRLASSPADTLARAHWLAQNKGWEVVTFDPENGILEAVDTSRFFRFKDNIVVRVRPGPQGQGSLVDMRSMSRVGVSDIGVNARRVRDFLADMQRN
jgi:hypothetical protein